MRTTLSCSLRPPRSSIRLVGDFDLHTRQHLVAILGRVRDASCSRVDVDASGVTFLDASCMRVLHLEARRLHERGGWLRITSGSEVVHRLVRTAGYADLMPAGVAPPRVPRQRAGTPSPSPQTT